MRSDYLRFIGIVGWMMILAEIATTTETPVELNLLNLAKAHFNNDIKPAEELLFRNTANGTRADCTQGKDSDPANAATWGDDRIIRADRLMWLCIDREASQQVTSRGVDIMGARIDKKVDLAWTKIQFPLRTFKCAFTDDIDLNRSSLRILKLLDTYIKGLNGNGLTVEQDILLNEGFQAHGEVLLQDARIGGSIDCGGGRFSNSSGIALNLENAKTGAVYLNRAFAAEGQVRLRNVESGTVDCGCGHFINSGEGEHGTALNLENAKTGAVYLNEGFRAEGEVRLRNAESGTVDCIRGHFINPGERRIALNLENAKTGSVFLTKGFEAQGEVRLALATIGGDVDCHGGKFINCQRTRGALDASGANVQGDVTLDAHFEADGKVVFKEARIGSRFVWRGITASENTKLDLQFARAKTLLNEKGSWPKKANLFLNGFVFDELDTDAESSAKTQIDWIKLQQQFRSQPYEQMAEVFRKMGRPEEAVKVMVAKNDDAGTNAIDEDWKKERYLKILGDFFWYRAFGKLIDFGYHPWRALLPSVLFVLLGAALFELGFRAQIVIPTDDNAYDPGTKELRETYPKFNALVYSLETFVPLLKLGIVER